MSTGYSYHGIGTKSSQVGRAEIPGKVPVSLGPYTVRRGGSGEGRPVGRVPEETMAIGTEVFPRRCRSSMATGPGDEPLCPSSGSLLTHWPTDLGFLFFLMISCVRPFSQQPSQPQAPQTGLHLWGAGHCWARLAWLGATVFHHAALPVWSVALSVYWRSLGSPPHSPFSPCVTPSRTPSGSVRGSGADCLLFCSLGLLFFPPCKDT